MNLIRMLFFGLILNLVLLLLDCHGAIDDDAWDYWEKGPTTGAWCKLSSLCCTGNRQSPLVVSRKSAKSADGDLTVIDYDKDIELIGLNNGKTVIFTLSPNNKGLSPKIKGEGLDGDYLLHSIQFHWGSNNSLGAEHRIRWGDSTFSFPLEAQLVHYKATEKSYEAAINNGKKNTIAIVAQLYTPENNRITLKFANGALIAVVKSLPNIVTPGQTTTITVKLREFLRIAGKATSFLQPFRYLGSQHTPPCTENVIWIVMMPMKVSDADLEVFRTLEGKGSRKLSNNFRPIRFGRSDYLNSRPRPGTRRKTQTYYK